MKYLIIQTWRDYQLHDNIVVAGYELIPGAVFSDVDSAISFRDAMDHPDRYIIIQVW